MVDQTSQFYAILTNVGAAKQANADALGIAWKITQMGVGDANNTDPTPNANQTSLINEWRRAPLNQLKVDDKDAAIIVAEQVIPAEVGGRWIREIGLYDADGDLVAVANCPPTYKPQLNQGSGRTQVVRMNLIVSNSSNVELKIDPSVVLATREWVTSELHKQDFKHSVLAATTANIALTGFQTIDGVALSAGARVLVKNQAAGKDNGLYTVAAGAWTRCPDADVSTEVTPGLLVLVERGTVNGDSAWQLVTDAPITVGVSALVFEMAFGRSGVAAGTYRSVTVDKYGRVVAATNPTTVEGYGLTDVYTRTQVDDLLGAAGWGAKGVSGSNIPVGTNLNAMTVPGSYGQTQNANATLALNYPVAAAGTLLVQSAGPQITTQQYTMYLTNRLFFRTSYGGSWDDWDEIPTVNSPKLTGIPEAPTAPKGTNTQQVATTAFVRGEVAGLVDSAPGALDTLKELAAAMGNDPNFATTVLNGLDSKVNVADKATKQLAEAGVDNVKWMTALSTLQSIIKQLNNIGLAITSAPLLPSFEAVVPGGFYLAYSGGASNPTPGGPPSIGNNVLGVFAITPRQDGTHFIAIENGGASAVRRIWFGQYNVLNGVPSMFWSHALTSDHIATQDQVDTGAADDVLVTPRKMRFGAIWSFAQNGYFFLPKWLGGFGLQWGIRAAAIPSSDSGAVSFPMSFASVFQVMAIPHGTAPLTTPLTLKTGAPTLTGVTFYVDGPVGGGGNVTPRWLALGRI